MTEVATANSIIEMLSDYLPRMHSEKPFYGLMSLVSHDGIVKIVRAGIRHSYLLEYESSREATGLSRD